MKLFTYATWRMIGWECWARIKWNSESHGSEKFLEVKDHLLPVNPENIADHDSLASSYPSYFQEPKYFGPRIDTSYGAPYRLSSHPLI